MKIFILGSARSGTTLASSIMARHPEVHRFNELHFFEEIWSPSDRGPLTADEALGMTQRLMKNEYESYVSGTDPARYRSQAEGFLREHPHLETGLKLFEAFLEWETRRSGRSIACTQTPRNVYYLDQILSAIEDASVIWLVRDPRAVLCSQKFRWRRRLWWTNYPSRYDALRAWMNYHPITYSLLWNAAVNAGERFVDHEKVLRVRFEDLVGEPETTVEGLMDSLDLEFDSAMLSVPQRGSSLKADRPEREGIDRAAADRWRDGCLDKAEVFLCERLTYESMVRHGYEASGGGVNWFSVLFPILTWLPKTGLAVLLNRARTRSSLLTLRRRLRRVG